MSSGKVKVYSNINWINNFPPKPTLIVLDSKSIRRVNKELSL